jgi:hypothetical protein
MDDSGGRPSLLDDSLALIMRDGEIYKNTVK